MMVFLEILVIVDGGKRAIIWDRFRGLLPKSLGEGTHFRIPLIQYPKIIEIRTRPYDVSTATGTKDMQTVSISIRVLFRPNIETLVELYRQYGENIEGRVIYSVANEDLKSIIAKYDAELILTNRNEFINELKTQITKNCSKYNIVVEDVAVLNMSYGVEFTKSCEQKMATQQSAEKAKWLVIQSKYEKLVKSLF